MKNYIIMKLLILLTFVASNSALQIGGVNGNQSVNRTCVSTNFFCADKMGCIPVTWVCDGDRDCYDGSDEEPSRCKKECTDEEFKCGDDTCIPKLWQCDNTEQCLDGSDEQSCTHVCEGDKFHCTNGGCIDSSMKCNGHDDCNDNSDEIGCSGPIITSFIFLCKDGQKISKFWQCDGAKDCPDGSDEEDCTLLSLNANEGSPCAENEVRCGTSDYCIKSHWVCDGHYDCPAAEDEQDCSNGIKCSSDEFACNDKTCIMSHLRCNGKDDCPDASDELNCTNNEIKTCNTTTHFACDDKLCIERKFICDQQNNCPDGKDESVNLCGVDECEKHNGGCQHICQDLKEGHFCKCREGFVLDGKYNCKDINECEETPGICSQECTNTVGSFHCACSTGYQRDPTDFTRCKAATGETYLLFSHAYDIRRIRLRDNDMTPVVKNLQRTTALDFLFNDNQIVWADKNEQKLFRASFDQPETRETILAHQNFNADGLAVDWIHRNIYFTDAVHNSVKLISWTGEHTKTLAEEGLDQPRCIAVNPSKGYIFWSDWGREPKIERSQLDGSERKAIVSGTKNLGWPNGITIDPSTDQIYWVDARRNTITTANMDGSGLKVVLYDNEYLRMPFSISVFEDRMYWTDMFKLAIYSADKQSGVDIRNHTHGGMQMDAPQVVRVFHQYRQPPSENVCADFECNQLCVRTVFGGPSCVCADGFQLSEDRLTCVLPGSIIPIDKTAELPIEPEPMILEPIYPEGPERIEDIFIESNRPNYSSILSAVLGTLVIVVVLVGFLTWLKLRSTRRHRGVRFHNPVYKKTTDDIDDTFDDAFTIPHHPIFAQQMMSDAPPAYTDRDDVPLTAE